MEKSLRLLKKVLFSKAQPITHVHVYGLAEVDVLRKIEKLVDKEADNWLVARANCYYVDGSLSLLLTTLAKALGSDKKITTIDDFRAVIFAASKGSSTNIMIILDDADALCQFPAITLNSLISISHSVQQSNILLRFVTTCQVPWFKLEINTESIGSPIEINIPNWTKDECIDTLEETFPGRRKMTKFILDTVFDFYRSYSMLKKIVAKVFAIYEHDQEFHLKHLTDCIKQVQHNLELELTNQLSYGARGHEEVDYIPLSLGAKYMAIAAFCASHNSFVGNRRFFIMHHGREKRRDCVTGPTLICGEQKGVGPNPCDRERIQFIYLALIKKLGGLIQPELDVLGLIGSLCSMGLLTRLSSISNFDVPKYKCLLSYESALEISKSIKFDLNNHLEARC